MIGKHGGRTDKKNQTVILTVIISFHYHPYRWQRDSKSEDCLLHRADYLDLK